MREVLEHMVFQFGYRGVKNNKPVIHTGGLSALEEAFNALGWSDPKFFEDMDGAHCDVKGCAEWVSVQGGCWADTGYWCICSKHHGAFLSGKPQPEMKERAIEREASRDPVTRRLPMKEVTW